MERNQLIAERIQTGLLFLWSAVFLLLPLFFTTFTTEAFIFPKALLVAGTVLLSLLGIGTRMLLLGQVRIKRTPLDVPVILFVVAIFLSTIFTVNKYDSLIADAFVLFAALAYFAIVNLFYTKKAIALFLGSLITGSVVATIITILARAKVYLLPFAATKTTSFTPLGSYLEFVFYIVLTLPLALVFLQPILKKKLTARVGIAAVASLVLVAGLVAGFIGLSTDQKPVLLPFDTGFQTTFAAISQDSGRVLQSFFFGNGYGNYSVVFSRFHPAALNANQQLWYLMFNSSSSYLLELLATTGLVGVLAYLFLLYRTLTPIAKKKVNPFFFSLFALFVVSFVLPISPLEIIMLFILTAGFTLYQREHLPHEYFDVEFKFVALKKGIFAFTTLDEDQRTRRDNNATPIAAFVILLAITVLLGFYSVAYAMSDMTFQASLVAANKNNGTVTYKLQTDAITEFPFRSAYYRIFSQTNIALANSLLSLSQGSKSSPSAQAQQTAFTLVQQGITTAQQATRLAPQSAIEWQNLSSVYRSLIGVGQNAQNFAISAGQQAAILDPVNPQEYVTLGGLYYQIGQYDSAIRMFQQAVALKNDYANAYYNLGHSYEQKGDLQDALAAYQAVQTLVAKDQTSYDKITAEISALQAKIGTGTPEKSAPAVKPSAAGTQQPLTLPGQGQQPSQQSLQQTTQPVQTQQPIVPSPTGTK